MTVVVDTTMSSVTSLHPEGGVSEKVGVSGLLTVTDNAGNSNFSSLLSGSMIYSEQFWAGSQTATFLGLGSSPSTTNNTNIIMTTLPQESILDTKPDTLQIRINFNINLYPTGDVAPYGNNSLSFPAMTINIDEPGGC